MTLDTFIGTYNGKSLDWDKVYGAQCVDLIQYYLRDVIGSPPMWGNAIDAFTGFDSQGLSNYMDRVANNPNDASQAPKRGDIVVWAANTPGSGGAGHIAIYLGSNAAGSFYSLDQNWGGMYVRQVFHDWSNVVGWLTPKSAPAQGEEEMVGTGDNWFHRFKKMMEDSRGSDRAGQVTRDEFMQSAANKPLLRVLEAVSDSAERDQNVKDANLGRLARRDNWQGQIYGLQDNLKKLQEAINQQNVIIAELTADKGATKSQYQEAVAKLGELNAQLATAHDQIKDLQSQPAEDTQLLNGLGQWLQKLIARLGVKK